jgi:type II secretory pathway pseudopilin PulG
MNLYKLRTKIKAAKKNDPDAGFTLLEVIVAALILMAFVAVSAQSILISNIVRIKAQERARANQAIQEDMEILRLLGSNDTSVTYLLNPDADTCAAVSYAGGYAKLLDDAFDERKISYSSTFGAIDNSFASENINFNSVSNASSSLYNNNLNYQLRLRRQIVTDPSDSKNNFKTLRIRYRVETTKKTAEDEATAFAADCNYSNNCVLDEYIEVIPNVALRCP